MKKPIAIATSDWHFWHIAPVWRSNEPDWLEAMGRNLNQIIEASYRFNVPIINGGDIFDHFNPTPETVNFLLSKLVNEMYAVPGQHDLQNHVLENLEKTGFHTLQCSGRVLYCEHTIETEKFKIFFAPWGIDLEEIEVEQDEKIKILLAHKYVWFDENTRYGGSNIPSGKLSGIKAILQNFDFAIFGDNHIPFRKKIGKCQVINCGTMVRRKLDEKDYETGYTILFDDRSIEFVPFDITKDVNLEIKITDDKNSEIDISSRKFMEELQSMQDGEIDYKQEIERKIEETNRQDMNKEFCTIFNNYEEQK